MPVGCGHEVAGLMETFVGGTLKVDGVERISVGAGHEFYDMALLPIEWCKSWADLRLPLAEARRCLLNLGQRPTDLSTGQMTAAVIR
jgi:hypothetical protein